MFVSRYHILYHFLDNVRKGKTATKLALDFYFILFYFFYLYFFIVRLPHWILDMSLTAQSGVIMCYLLFIYIPMMKLCRMCSNSFVFVILYSRPIWFDMLFCNASFVS